MHGNDIVGIVAIVMIFGGGTITYAVKGMLRLAEKRIEQNNKPNTETLKALQELRAEVASLRETTTRFDMSFDAGMTQLESRVNRLETTGVVYSNGTSAAKTESETVLAGRG